LGRISTHAKKIISVFNYANPGAIGLQASKPTTSESKIDTGLLSTGDACTSRFHQPCQIDPERG
jgi:hypothetical protein